MDVLSTKDFIVEVLSRAENLLNECSGIPSRTITSAQIARGNCQPFCSVADCSTGFFPQNHFFRARSVTRPSLTLRFHHLCTTFVSPLACFKLRNKRTRLQSLQSSSLQVLLLLAQSCKELTKWFTYSAVIWTQTSNIVFHLDCLRI